MIKKKVAKQIYSKYVKTEYEIWKLKQIKSYLKILLSLIKLEITIFLTSFENKTLSEELQDYKVKSVKGLQDYIYLEGKGYKITREEGLQKSFWGRRRGRAILDLKL